MTELVKSDWLYRYSSFSRRWKREWFILYLRGELKYYGSKESGQPDGIIYMGADCINITTGAQSSGEVSLPEGLSATNLFKLDFRDGKYMLLCAETEDDMRAWQFALEQARVIARFAQAPQSTTGPVPMTAVTGDGRQVPVYMNAQMAPPPGSSWGSGQQPFYLPPNTTVFYDPNTGHPVYAAPSVGYYNQQPLQHVVTVCSNSNPSGRWRVCSNVSSVPHCRRWFVGGSSTSTRCYYGVTVPANTVTPTTTTTIWTQHPNSNRTYSHIHY